MYGAIRNLLFKLSPEQAHNFSLKGLDMAHRLGVLKHFVPAVPAHPVTVMGLNFPNPVGLAAGLDKDADHLGALGDLGFGFIEVGTVTPLAQPGNPEPRAFRLPEHQALINRMGFNNKGLEYMLAQIDRRKFRGVLGINVGKNKNTPEQDAALDYRKCIAAVYTRADYIAVNVSSPNTPGLRNLQFGDSLKHLLTAVKSEQLKCQAEHGHYVPIAVKIAPDMDDAEIRFVANALMDSELDAVIATNTTVDREAVAGHVHCNETGGLSGAPVREPSLRVIRGLYAELGERLPIIGVGGISDGASAAEKIQAGAKLVQIYTGFIYKGPALIGEATAAIKALGRAGV